MTMSYTVTVWKYNSRLGIAIPLESWFHTYRDARQAFNLSCHAIGIEYELPKRIKCEGKSVTHDKLNRVEIHKLS